jgi:Flp pilus assembly protein TadD
MNRFRPIILLTFLVWFLQFKILGQNDSSRFAQAHKYALKGNFTAAIPILTKLIEHNPKNENAFRERGSCYMEQSKFKESLGDYNQAIALDTVDALAYENRGTLYSIRKMNAEALLDFKKAIQLDSCNATAYCSCGTVMLGMNKFDDAEVFFRKAIQVAPAQERSMCYYNLGYTYLLKGTPKKAVTHLSLAITLDPKFPEAYRYRAQAYKDLHNSLAYNEDMAKYLKLTQKPQK